MRCELVVEFVCRAFGVCRRTSIKRDVDIVLGGSFVCQLINGF